MNKELLRELNRFLRKAMMSTYAGGGKERVINGFKELEFKKGNWYYKDSYTGFFQSWGREVVWCNQKPVWTQVYGGGMRKKFQKADAFEHKTFEFLKKALSSKQQTFQPRGPKSLKDGDWKYVCEWHGDISRFAGHEEIRFKRELVFTHDFLGGLIIAK